MSDRTGAALVPESSDKGTASTPVGACAAPVSSLYFRPDGYVAACCGGWHLLGRVTGPERRSLREIWTGEQAQLLRDAVEQGDYGLGCWECGQLAAAGQREASLAADFDRYRSTGTAEFPAMIDFALSNRCNLQCVMCNGGLSSAIRRHREHRDPMPNAYDDRFFDELTEFLPHLRRAQFKGGEPFLAPENVRVWDELLALNRRPEVCVTTNGTIWNERVERYVEELAMEVILSVDAVDAGTLEQIRVGVDADRLWSNVDRFRSVTDRTGATFTLCMCLMSTNWAELAPFLLEADRRGVEASIIWVDGPAGFNLLTVPLPELTEVLRELRAAASSAVDLPPGLRAIWDRSIERIEQTVEHRSRQEAATAVAVPRRAHGVSGSLVDRYRAELSGAARTELLELEYEQDIIRAVHVPQWAEWLQPDTWIGTGLEQTMTVISTASHTTMRSEVESLQLGVHRARLTFGSGVSATRVDAYYVPDDSTTGGHSHLLLAPVDGSGGNGGPPA